MDTVDKISTAQFQQLLRQQTVLREIAEKEARQAREQVLRVALALCGDAIDHIRREHTAGLDGWSLTQIADLVIADATARLSDVELAQRIGGDTPLLQQARDRLAEVQRQLDASQRQALNYQQGWKQEQEKHAESRSALQAAEGQIKVLKRSLSDAEKRLQAALAKSEQLKAQVDNLGHTLKQAQSPLSVAPPPFVPVEPDQLPQVRLQPPPESSEPDWMQAWRQHRNFERASRLILAIGNTGECRRLKLAQMLAAVLELDNHNDTRIKRAFKYATEAGLIEIIAFKQIIPGNSPHLVKLTERGAQAYRFLTGQEAAVSVYDRLKPRHKTEAHTFLNLEAADLLALAGYQPDLFSFDEERVSGGKFRPDIKATSSDGEVLFVEAERDPARYGPTDPQRMRKWDIYYDASYGHFAIVTSDRAAMNNLRSEVAYWQHARQRPLRLWITNVTEAQAGQRGPDGSLWLVKEQFA